MLYTLLVILLVVWILSLIPPVSGRFGYWPGSALGLILVILVVLILLGRL